MTQSKDREQGKQSWLTADQTSTILTEMRMSVSLAYFSVNLGQYGEEIQLRTKGELSMEGGKRTGHSWGGERLLRALFRHV